MTDRDDVIARALIEYEINGPHAFDQALADAGLVIVPREPTEAMMDAGDTDIMDALSKHSVGMMHGHPEHASHSVYRAMIAAAIRADKEQMTPTEGG